MTTGERSPGGGARGYAFRPAWWVPGAHAQTLWGKFFRRTRLHDTRVETWDTPDGDAVELLRLAARNAESPRLLLLHGLEGTARSHYVGGFLAEARRRDWACDLLLFRGCGAAPNVAPRFYHSGETGDLAFVVSRLLRDNHGQALLLAGVSLGGNVLLKWLGEHGADLDPSIRGAAAISVPYDLELGARFIGTGVRRIYDSHFLRTLKAKAFAKLATHPTLFDADSLRRARSVFEFDEAVTAPVHGFADAHDYYTRSSAIGWLHGIRRPTLLMSALDDPFLPPGVLELVRSRARENPCLSIEFPAHGGHVGFVGGRRPWRPRYYAEWRACEFLATLL